MLLCGQVRLQKAVVSGDEPLLGRGPATAPVGCCTPALAGPEGAWEALPDSLSEISQNQPKIRKRHRSPELKANMGRRHLRFQMHALFTGLAHGTPREWRAVSR